MVPLLLRLPLPRLASPGQAALFYLDFGNGLVPDIREACINPYKIWARHEWSRLIWAGLLHLDGMHLYYNMGSFLWKGVSLERRMGSWRFGWLIAELLLSSHLILVAMCYGLSAGLPNDYRCA